MRIVVKQVSGLGNQLFQYAAGRYYAQKYGAELRVVFAQVRSPLSHGRFPRPLLLSNFSVDAPVRPLTAVDRLLLSPRKGVQALTSALKRTFGIQVYAPPFEERYRFCPSLPLKPAIRTVYLLGYWQTYRMVEEVAVALRKEFAFTQPAQGKNLRLLKEIQQTPTAVSVHIRRGDYLLQAEGNIALPMSYYRRAMTVIEERLSQPRYFVFSDDLDFARSHLPHREGMVFVDNNDDYSSHEDLRLMSSCAHHVIANSTFSWWGAWLNARPDKQVIAPRHWHLTAESFYPDLLPPGWTLLDSIREQ